jgi:hypothetical protein
MSGILLLTRTTQIRYRHPRQGWGRPPHSAATLSGKHPSCSLPSHAPSAALGDSSKDAPEASASCEDGRKRVCVWAPPVGGGQERMFSRQGRTSEAFGDEKGIWSLDWVAACCRTAETKGDIFVIFVNSSR